MIIVGLAGGIGAGKSTLSKAFLRLNIPVHSSDAAIHELIEKDKDVQMAILKKWPEASSRGQIDRITLRKIVLFELGGLSYLEDILYPKLLEKQKTFLKNNRRSGTPVVVMDVPLLFETGLDRYCHYVIVASAPKRIRRERVLRRKEMNDKQLQAFESRQMKDFERKKYADYIVPCGLNKGYALKKVKEIQRNILQRPEKKWQGRWPSTLKRIAYGP